MCLFHRYPELKLHDKGPMVWKAAELLRKHGSNLKSTEEFTIAMRSAVLSFQKKHNLEQTAIIDKNTWKALNKKHKVC